MKPSFLLFSALLTQLACAAAPPPPPSSATVSPVASAPNPPATPHVPLLRTSFVGQLQQPVTSFGAAATATHLYVLGGYFGPPHEYSKEGQSERFTRLNFESGEWEALESSGRVQSATLNEYGGRLYRIGGLRADNADGEDAQLTTLSDFGVYDPETRQWRSLTPLPEPRSSHEAVFIGSKLYVIGGWALSGGMDSGEWSTTLLETDVAVEPIVWRSSPAPFRSRALGAAAAGRRLLAIGGITGSKPESSVRIYDTESGAWSAGPELPEPGFGVRATTLNDRVYVSGASGVVHTLDEQRSSWIPIAQLNFPRMFHQLTSRPTGELLFSGGIPGMGRDGRVAHIERLSFEQAPPKIQSWTVKVAPPAKNRQGTFLQGNQLYVFGGNNGLGQHDFEPENFIADAYRLDLGSLSWHKIEDFPRRRQSMQTLITSRGEGIAVGGFGIEDGALKTRSEVFRFDLKYQTWELAPGGLPESRTQFGLVEHAERLWVFGGLDFDQKEDGSNQFVHPLPVLALDLARPEAGFTDSGIALPRPRRAFSSALLGDRYYLVGGMAQNFGLVESCDVFDFPTKTWETFPCPPRVRIGAEMVALNGKLYLVAGRSKKTPEADLSADDSIEVFDPDTGRWSTWLERLPIEDTHQLRVFPFRDQLLVYTAQRPDDQAQVLLIRTD